MGRMKVGSNGQLYYDEADSGPDQTLPTAQKATGDTPPPTNPSGPSYSDHVRDQISGRAPATDWGGRTIPENPFGNSGDGGAQTQGGGIDDPRWTNGIWGGTRSGSAVGGAGAVGSTLETGRTYNDMSGWDTGKLNDPTRTGGQTGKLDAKYDFARTIQNKGITGAQLRGNLNLITDDPQMRQMYPNMRAIGDDKIDFGDGAGPVDLVRGSDQGLWWGAESAGGGGGGAPAGVQKGTGGPGGPDFDTFLHAGPGSSPGSTTGGGMDGRANSIYDLLMQRATAGLDIDPNDPIIKNQVDAYGAQEERSRRNYLSSAAEKAGESANLGAEARSSAEQVGQRTGSFQAELMGRELSARRGKIERALSGAAGFLTEQQRMSLQRELETLRLAQQESQFGRGLRQDESQFGRRLGQQESEFGRNLGQRESEFGRSDEFRRSPLA